MSKLATTQNPNSKLLTVSAAGAARLLGIGKAKALRLIHSGQIPAAMLDSRLRVKVADLEKFIASLPQFKPDAGVQS